MIPTAYELKRIIAQHRHRFWCADALTGLPAAPVYLFPDQEKFDCNGVDLIARRLSAAPLRLPHREVLFEVTNRGPDVSAIVAFVTTTVEETIVGFLFMRDRRTVMRWTDALCYAEFMPDGAADCSANISIKPNADAKLYFEVLTGVVWRSLALLSDAAMVREDQFPRTRRPKLARKGVSGWTYRIVEIDPRWVATALRETTGTHASPRWHIRRGHWRTLRGGRRTFVRECEVGDPAQGGVVKDYRVQMEARA